MQVSPLREIANELPFFKTVDDREKLLGVVGAEKGSWDCWMP